MERGEAAPEVTMAKRGRRGSKVTVGEGVGGRWSSQAISISVWQLCEPWLIKLHSHVSRLGTFVFKIFDLLPLSCCSCVCECVCE